jgi:hypothetical protein
MYSDPLAGVKVTDSVCVPTVFIVVPDGGVYTNVPAIALPLADAVAFNCAGPSAIPRVMAAGVAHVIVGVVGLGPPPGVQPATSDPANRAPFGATRYVVQSGKFTQPFTIGYNTLL